MTLLKTGPYTGSVTERRVFAAAVLLFALTLIGPARPLAQAIQRSMYVSVLNEAGAPVPDLGPSDFIVREDNATREVLRVAPAEEPMQIVLLVDTSQAARDNIPYIRTALPPFVAALTGAAEGDVKNEIAIVAIGERPTIFTNSTTNRVNLQKGIDRLWSLQGTGAYLLDGIIEVCQGFKKRDAPRPVIIAITTEGPELSNRDYQQVLDPLRASGAAFYALVIGHPSGSLSHEARNREMVLDEGPRTTGGRRDEMLTAMALSARLKQLADELMHQYRVTYARPQSLIPPEHVTVAARKPGLTARGTLIKDQQGRP